ncbi:MAG: hypothetical protein HYY06_05490 [Deltaproteobacteria bacterium]|nr:hypothetical protein [Deltaproteobacteria bacterium]
MSHLALTMGWVIWAGTGCSSASDSPADAAQDSGAMQGRDSGMPPPDGASHSDGGARGADAGTGDSDGGAGDPDGAATPADAGAALPDAGEFETCPGAAAERNGNTAFDLERASFAGFTELHVTFCNPLFAEQPDHLLFRVLIDDHEGMPPSDLTSGSYVVSSAGVRVDDRFSWDGTDLMIGEHHAGGWLTAPAATSPSMDDPGTPLIGPDTTWIELHLGGIGDGQYDPYFRWDEEYLP